MSEQTFTGTKDNQEWRVRLVLDQDPENPRKGQENDWTLVCAHKKYILGDQMIKDPEEMKGVLAAAGLNRKTALVKPIYMYDHTGLIFSLRPFSSDWDSGQIGEAFIARTRIKSEFSGKTAAALRGLESELDTYQSYVAGEVYGIVYETRPAHTFDEDSEQGWKEEAACWGYYGEDSARESIANLVPEEVALAINSPKKPEVAPAARRRRAP